MLEGFVMDLLGEHDRYIMLGLVVFVAALVFVVLLLVVGIKSHTRALNERITRLADLLSDLEYAADTRFKTPPHPVKKSTRCPYCSAKNNLANATCVNCGKPISAVRTSE
jgi:hypothetical protein